MTTTDDLLRLCPPPTATPVVNWPAVEQSLGMRLPSDYKQLADAYGPGSFCGFLHLYHPLAPTDWVNLTGPTPTTIRRQLQHDHDSGTHPVPHDPQQLFAMGVTDNGEYLFWIQEPENTPDEWNIAVNEARGPRWYTHQGGITDFLLTIFTGREHVPLFPGDLLDQGISFTPSRAATSRQQPHPKQLAGGSMSSEEIRTWARAHGYEVNDRGRIPSAIIDAYKQAHDT
ncbi:histone-like nucleoid-structuring protein Lsr2 [Streptomyces sp. NPDC058667]|uniref:Lsr2 family DNA-binding protein n=1 Tax=Streptomyces sp. NPDC058667 TaxID=3346588 RepID=UPI00364CB060